MKLLELLNVLDKNENIQIIYRDLESVDRAKRRSLINILDLKVKNIKLDGGATLSVEIEPDRFMERLIDDN